MTEHHPAADYAGDLSPQEAWEKISDGALLVDVRSKAEWNHVGVPDTSAAGSQPLFVEWNHSDGSRNPDFLAGIDPVKGREVIFLCRSGKRSVAAAYAAAGAGHTAYNVLHGFETEGGWQDSGLSWKKP